MRKYHLTGVKFDEAYVV
jgi:WD40 repeat protein